MASFVMHYIVGEKFLDSIDNYDVTDYDKNNFRLGNLVVDTLGVNEYSRYEKLERKMITHFRNIEDYDKCIQIPNVDKFRDKYNDLINKDYSAMGYLLHLYTDKIFFEYLYGNVIDILDKDMNITNSKKDNYYIRVCKNNKIYRTNEFYNGNISGLYKDYSNMNNYLINNYNVSFNYEELREFISKFKNPGIKEIDYNNIGEVIDKMVDIVNNSINSNINNLEVFNIFDIDRFIYNTVKIFNNKYQDNIKKLVRVR